MPSNVTFIERKEPRYLPRSRMWKQWLVKHEYSSPIVCNGLVDSIWLALKMRCSRLVIVGADFDMHKYLEVSTDNAVYLNTRHFNRKAGHTYRKNDKKKSLAHKLRQISLAMESLEDLRCLADTLEIPIVNLSKSSQLDMFDRGH